MKQNTRIDPEVRPLSGNLATRDDARAMKTFQENERPGT